MSEHNFLTSIDRESTSTMENKNNFGTILSQYSKIKEQKVSENHSNQSK